MNRLLSSQILQNTIDGLKNITRRDMSVVDREGKVIASTEEEMLNRKLDSIIPFINSPAESQLVSGNQYFKVFDNGIAECITIISGEDEESYRIGKIAAFQIQSLLVAYKERYDKDGFVKNLLLDNLLLIDIYSRAKKLRIENSVGRIVYLIESPVDRDMQIVDVVREEFSDVKRDFVTVVNESSIILVKEIDENEDVDTFAKTIVERLYEVNEDMDVAEENEDGLGSVYVAIGTKVTDLKNVSASYKEAKMALEVGQIFNPQVPVVNYEKLGIGRLIYQLPLSLCDMFLKEVLGGITMDDFDEETLTTVSKFFDNDLNVSETSRQLYIHRNTLVYRLDKLEKLTGLDLRNFDDAIVFKITMMVSRYMKYKQEHAF